MPQETALSFLRILERGGMSAPVFLISGPQEFLREYVLDALRDRLRSEGRACRSYQVGAGADFGGVLNELGAADLFAPRKAVVCRVLRSRRGPEKEDGAGEGGADSVGGVDESAMAAAIERKTWAGELILVYDRDSAPAKIRRAVERGGITVNCARPFENQIDQYAQVFARALGLKLAPEAADALVSCYASDLGAMANALGKAALHSERGARLTAADLRDPGAGRMPELFDLAESLARGRAAPTLAMLDRAIAGGRDVFEILAVEIAPVIRRMLLAAATLERRGTVADLAAALGFSPTSGIVTRAAEGARRFGRERLRRAHQRVCELDAGFKMGLRREREAAVSEALIELMSPANG